MIRVAQAGSNAERLSQDVVVRAGRWAENKVDCSCLVAGEALGLTCPCLFLRHGDARAGPPLAPVTIDQSQPDLDLASMD